MTQHVISRVLASTLILCILQYSSMGLCTDSGGALRHCCYPCPTSKTARWLRQHLALKGHTHLNCRRPPVCASANVWKGDEQQTGPNALRKLLLQPGIVKVWCCPVVLLDHSL